MKSKKIKYIDISDEKLEELRHKIDVGDLQKDDSEILKLLIESYSFLVSTVKDKNVSIDRLRKLVFGNQNEKTDHLLDKWNSLIKKGKSKKSNGLNKEETKGHGRKKKDAYKDAEKVEVKHSNLKNKDKCPDCDKGKVYKQTPTSLLRITGAPPLKATVYKLEKFRCNVCGKLFTADVPTGVNQAKYDPTAMAMISLLKYGSGLPFFRLENLQNSLETPLSTSTQWDVVNDAAKKIYPVFEKLKYLAAQGEVIHNDDTPMKILSLLGKLKRGEKLHLEYPKRKGIFTTGIVSKVKSRKIVVFLTDKNHAGESIAEVLRLRDKTRNPPIQMCDALSRNIPKKHKVIVANCLVHGRRNFIDVGVNFPDECRYVLEQLEKVYENEAFAQKKKLSPFNRLEYHKINSGKLMEELKKWLKDMLEEKKSEHNSGLGKAITYMLNHWSKLTLFLRVAGAPLDNNICERALKKAVLHRKNAYFYLSERGAYVGDLFMSLIHTAELSKVNPYKYMTELIKNAKKLKENPDLWMPWNYHVQLEI